MTSSPVSGVPTTTLLVLSGVNATGTSGPYATPAPHTISAANFTQVTRNAAISQSTCYHLPRSSGSASNRRAVLRNAQLREDNATIPYPYVQSVAFDNQGIDPLWLTVRDYDGGTHNLDVSNRSRVAIVDTNGNSLMLDGSGIHFATNSCSYDVSLGINNLYQQLANLSGQACSSGKLKKRLDDMQFNQTLYLRDQCGNPVKRSLRPYPRLRVGSTECIDVSVDETTGQWSFDCTFPGDESSTLRCQSAVQNGVMDFLFRSPFAGACPDVSTAITTLSEAGKDFMSTKSLEQALYDQGLDDAQKAGADEAVAQYEQLWTRLVQTFVKNVTVVGSTPESPLMDYINVYNRYRNFEDDICEDLHLGEIPLKLALTAGATYLSAITTLDWAPDRTQSYNVSIQDSSEVACCAAGSTASSSLTNGTCAYPASAVIGNSGCLCGKTVDGRSLAFESTECDNFVGTCTNDGDCEQKGHAGYVCLTGSCCGSGVCIDPYACAQNGTVLVENDQDNV